MKFNKAIISLGSLIFLVLIFACSDDGQDENEALKAKIAELENAVSDLQVAVDANRFNIGNISDSMVEAKEEFDTRMIGMSAAIKENKDKLAQTEGKIEIKFFDWEGAIIANQNRTGNISERLVEIEGQLKELIQSDAGEANNEIADLWLAIEKIKSTLTGPDTVIEKQSNADMNIVGWSQSHYLRSGDWGDLVQIWYSIKNIGAEDIDFYRICFAAICADNTVYEDWTSGTGLKRGSATSDYVIIDVPEKEVVAVEITDYEFTAY